ncbi:dTDP-4-dehydrorhamnose reductase [Clostridium sp. SM-530-WT-3G]|uniref:dTDP-4-dehydrorhamnose reductase n=1 Tax=Clostridium sp. SM-530-WT-3G TaxID=2725303 RepID=UPI00145F32A2|nr:dTDP-4-dehydrorhamnose reductase [Clostridium sp. SM-530-WT-3G]NME83080.1 dTDP-4-dehydrorhamnose reductase [Clostridium sp. SM-530-WT-3G]
MILITGVNGQLGFDIAKELKRRNVEFIGTAKNDLDVTDREATENYILKINPDCVIHCAAYTDVDRAEEEKDMCYKVNCIGTENIARACKKAGAKMIYISTDYIFDGKGKIPFEVNDAANPLNVYGRSKYEGEKKVSGLLEKYFIVRVSWIFGANGKNFVKSMLNLGTRNRNLNVVCDQVGSPTYTVDLAVILCDMLASDQYGVYNVTNEGFCSWAEFAEEIMKQSNLGCKINYISTKKYRTKATRPLNSRMSKLKLYRAGFKRMPLWNDALNRYLREIGVI